MKMRNWLTLAVMLGMTGCIAESATDEGGEVAVGSGGASGENTPEIRETGYLVCMPGAAACITGLACETPNGEIDCLPFAEACAENPTCECAGDVCRQGRVCVDQDDGSIACEGPNEPDPDPGPGPDPDPAPGACEALGEAACADNADCVAYYGYPYPAACDVESNPEARTFVACGDAEPNAGACNPAVECAAGPEGVFGFPECVPPGYGACPPVDMCFEEPNACTGLDEDACRAADGCYPYMAYVLGQENTSFVACDTPPENGCDDVLTCAASAETGEARIFPDSCVAPGWVADAEACNAPSPAGCEGLDEASCVSKPECVPVMGHVWCGPELDTFIFCGEQIPEEQDKPGIGICPACAVTAGGVCIGVPGVGVIQTSENQEDVYVYDDYEIFECEELPPCNIGCDELGEEACMAAEACRPVYGAPAQEICMEDFSNWMSVYGGCIDVDRGCGDAETCGEDPRALMQSPLVFPDTCLPQGWVPCDLEQVCE
ncbi:MAG: hypothetical protein ACE366_08740 [Bradymonadia bacterium]